MFFLNQTIFVNRTILFLLLVSSSFLSFSQKLDSTKTNPQLNGAITVTNNGVSVIPTFNLGNPAMIFDFIAKKKRFSFEPQLRFAIQDVKPWSFIFWMRYKLIQAPKFSMGIGFHPSFVFQTTLASVNGISKELITIRRFYAAELTPTYKVSKNVNIGIYYLRSRGLADATKNTNFVTLNSTFSNINLRNQVYITITPQVYYLKLDQQDGYYVTSNFTLAKHNFPFSITSTINKKIQSTIPSKDFLWNLSLVYSY